MSALRKKLVERVKIDVSTDTLVELAELVLKNNISNFNGKILQQKKEAQDMVFCTCSKCLIEDLKIYKLQKTFIFFIFA